MKEFLDEEARIRLYAEQGLMSADDERFIRLLNLAREQRKLLVKCEDILSRFDVSVLTTVSRGKYQDVFIELNEMGVGEKNHEHVSAN